MYSGSVVITDDTGVDARGIPLAITLVQTSLKVRIPTKRSSSTIRAALRQSDIRSAANSTVSPGDTMLCGLPIKSLCKVGKAFPPVACAISGSKNADRTAAWPPPFPPMTFIIASLAAVFALFSASSSFVMASLRHLLISKTPQIAPRSHTTGKCLYRFLIIVDNASIAESVMVTQVGLGVMTWDNSVVAGSRCLAATRRVISVSVIIPTKVAESSIITAALLRLAANSFEHEKTVSVLLMSNGFFRRSLDTGRTSCLVDLEADMLSSSISIALLNIDLHPSRPPHPFITSITSTRPDTAPLLSTTGRVRNLSSCIICNASKTVVSGETVSGLSDMT
mmetsp:Transcript_2100/g.2551  ORF Transcript_2100/g.2551 Transcript_2100/m.2551 type:complete len:337 (+) Transcript_2100:986-1996(+)